jgi:hypothetical protein
MNAGKDKTGIVTNVVDVKPRVVHRTLADFFTARLFSRNFESNRSILECILFDRGNRFPRDMFDRMFAKGFLMHYADLEEDMK